MICTARTGSNRYRRMVSRRRRLRRRCRFLNGGPATDLYPQHADAIQLSREILGAWVAPILARATAVYRLMVPREGNEHDWGWAVDVHGFHEYVAINRSELSVTLIIASDD